VNIFQCYCRTWWGIIQSSSTSKCIKTTLNAQLVTTELKRVFYHLKSVDCEKWDLWKVLVWLSMKKNEQLDFAACEIVFRRFSTIFAASNSFWNTQNLCCTMSVWFKKHAWELFQYSYVLFVNWFELNNDLKAIVEMTRPNKHQSRTAGQIVKFPSNFMCCWAKF